MKPKTMILTLAILASVSAAQASDNRIYVDVNGMVCDFCARSLEKVFGKQDAVSDIDVDLNDKVVTIDLKDGMSIEDSVVSELIQDAGYSVVAIRRVEEGQNEGG